MAPTRDEIERLLAENELRYQRVELPYGLATPGKDRRPTADIVMPQSLEGQSVLDVGSNLGFFCFEAERRGATRVLGTEISGERLREAELLKSVLESNVEFALRDILREPADEQFDLVLALNVIHHVTDPFAAIEALANLTKWRLAIEFPTFESGAFRRKNGVKLWRFYNKRALIGVRRARGITRLVFAPPAIQRAIQDYDPEPLFSSVRFIPSPMKARMIALCEKNH